MISTQHTRIPLPGACGSIAGALLVVLGELRSVVGSVSRERYAARAGEVFAEASIGGHVRHCLDHVRALVDGRRSGLVDYDHRARGTAIESDPLLALVEAEDLMASVGALAPAEADERVRVSVMPARDGECTVLWSTLARELAFVLSHTVHHNAMIRSMVVAAGDRVPGSFGFAPSTLAYRDRSTCAR